MRWAGVEMRRDLSAEEIKERIASRVQEFVDNPVISEKALAVGLVQLISSPQELHEVLQFAKELRAKFGRGSK